MKLLYFSFASRPPSKGEDEEDEKEEEEEEEETTTREWCDLLLDMIEGREVPKRAGREGSCTAEVRPRRSRSRGVNPATTVGMPKSHASLLSLAPPFFSSPLPSLLISDFLTAFSFPFHLFVVRRLLVALGAPPYCVSLFCLFS